MGERIAIIGAGPAGLTALRALTARGFDAVAFERGARVGGIWSLDRSRPTAAYRSLHLITSRPRTEFAEFPMPEDTPDYPSRDAVGEYLEAYVAHFGLGDRIRLSTGVAHARRRDGGGWELELDDGTAESFDRLVVASGHNEVPKWPSPAYPGADDFAGEQLHALDYGTAEDFRDRNVLVVGMGNSAMDIATDLSHTTSTTLLSVRRGSWIVPKRLLGKPADQVTKPWAAINVPWQIRQPVSQALLRVTVGSPTKYGFPEPSGGLFQDHPTITDTVPSRVSHGKIAPRPAISELRGDRVAFIDGREDPVDAIVWCTGYKVEIPFLEPSVTGEDPQELPLYLRVFSLDHPDLAFVGLMQSTGSALPIVEAQSQLLAAQLAGEFALPDGRAMRRECERRHARAMTRWGAHGRPTMRVDFDIYLHELRKALPS